MTSPKTPRPSLSTDAVTRYARAVVSGKKIAGPHVRDACKRHLDDLQHGAARGLVFDKVMEPEPISMRENSFTRPPTVSVHVVRRMLDGSVGPAAKTNSAWLLSWSVAPSRRIV